jgi:hypothetical protein
MILVENFLKKQVAVNNIPLFIKQLTLGIVLITRRILTLWTGH